MGKAAGREGDSNRRGEKGEGGGKEDAGVEWEAPWQNHGVICRDSVISVCCVLGWGSEFIRH